MVIATSVKQNLTGLIKLNPDGLILKTSPEAKKLLISEDSDSHNLFHRIKNNELKTKLHECFMGKLNEFTITLDAQPYFFLFHRSYNGESLESIHIYFFNVLNVQNSVEQHNWNNHLLSSIGEMAAGIAHEVRNPLTAVKGFLQLMDQSYNAEYSHIAQNELERAIHILNDLMSVSKPEFIQEKQTTFNLNAEIESILLLFQNQLYSINVIKHFENESSSIVGRKDQIKKALFNIIKNAIEAMPDSGTLAIEQTSNATGIQVSISDTGIGIPKDKLRLLGTPFFTLKQDGKGMGLAQVFNTIQSNNGKISVTSEEGHGTSFLLTFPKTIKHVDTFMGGHTMIQTIDSKAELSQFLVKNVEFYTKEWIQYVNETKSYISSLLRENGDFDYYNKFGNPIMLILAQNINELKTEEVMDHAKERGVSSAKTEFPIHLAWELFQSSRGIIWNGIKTFYLESQKALETEEFFALERHVNDINDLYIDSYTAYY